MVDLKKDQAILAFVPHGIVPFGLAFGVLTDLATKIFGFVHPVVATASGLFPVVRDFLNWAGAV